MIKTQQSDTVYKRLMNVYEEYDEMVMELRMLKNLADQIIADPKIDVRKINWSSISNAISKLRAFKAVEDK